MKREGASEAPVKSSGATYPHLFAPVRIGPLALRNRIVMGSMHMRLAFEGDDAKRLATFYAERARGGVAMIITGGVAPNQEGRMENGAAVLESESQIESHRRIVTSVHDHGSKCVMQILHAGRYAKHAHAVAPSDIPSPIGALVPRRLDADAIERTIEDYVRCALLARACGYDGIDVMGSEGYLINQFTASRTNNRADSWGGTPEKRARFAVEIVHRIRERVGSGFAILYRIFAVDLVEGGATAEETNNLARALEAAGVDAFSTGIGWHESRMPTIAYMVPRGAWRFAAKRLKTAVAIPVIASNRINTPALADDIVGSGDADLVALARPLLADADFALKARAGQAAAITPCIACNQACLDYIFSDRSATCLVNPRAGHEREYDVLPIRTPQRIAVAGAGAAGLAFAITAARRGQRVTLFDAAPRIGGQLALACRVPGKGEFSALIDHYGAQLSALGVDVRLGRPFTPAALSHARYDRVVIATGVRPRSPAMPGMDHPKIVWYPDVLRGAVEVGKRVAIIGAGAIAFDVAEFLTSEPHEGLDAFYASWGVDAHGNSAGALVQPALAHRLREVHLFQRSPGRPAARLGVSTGWILRASLKRHDVSIHTGCTYDRVDDAGLHYTVGTGRHVFDADTIVICAGQDPQNELGDALAPTGIPVTVIGGARDAHHLDARRAIDEGVRLALQC